MSATGIVHWLNSIGLILSLLMFLSLFFIPPLESTRDRTSLRFCRATILLWGAGYFFGSQQVLYANQTALINITTSIANVLFISSYFSIVLATSLLFKVKHGSINNRFYSALLIFVVLVTLVWRDNFVVRNVLLALTEGGLVLFALSLTLKGRLSRNRGTLFYQLGLCYVLFNLVVSYPLAALFTDQQVQFSWAFLLIVMSNTVVITLAIYALFLNKIIAMARKDSRIDALSGAYNRKILNEHLPEFYHSNYQGSVIICDIDHFKRINDEYGHCVGDQVIKRFAKHIKNSVRNEDSVIRYGGEEFLIKLPHASIELARDIAKRLCQSTRHLTIALDGHDIKFTASFGVFGDDQKTSLGEAIKIADARLMLAKQMGRDNVYS
ncbi:GGDEF domain-containing protein [Thalassotalea euphylliae]|uniref:GGDEF domain-containing protein n=1 Tax=Thalassotalea euphylliae TaxID=1655234 RepID=UPI0036350C6B